MAAKGICAVRGDGTSGARWPVAWLACALSAILAGPACAGQAKWSWQEAQAEVTPTGDLKWKPRPFKFQAGGSVRYIDYEKGSDANAGTGKRAPWKHHPWDPKASGKAKACRGVHTYVFKRGVIYRGSLHAKESGKPGNPIRLTSDPSWGKGEAVIAGSERVTGWRRGAGHKDIPQKNKVWYADLDFAPRCVWRVEGGEITRLALARTPNWKVSDPEDVMSEWWTWEQPRWWERKNKMTVKGRKMHLGVDKKHLTKGEEYYMGAVVRTEYGIVMGTPFPTEVEAFDPVKKGVAFQGIWWRDSAVIITKNRYYLEDKPHYLDEAGEFWFEKKGAGGRLYLRLPGDQDPNRTRVEAGKRYNLIEDLASAKSPKRLDVLGPAKRESLETAGVRHLEISGLSFRFTNTWWNLPYPPWMHKEVDNACIRLLGSSGDVRIANCRFAHAGKAVRIDQINGKCRAGRFEISDNDMRFIDHGVISVNDKIGGQDLKIMRNNLFMIGLRPYRQSHGHALSVRFADTFEVAGNVLDRCYGAGLFLFCGKGSGQRGDVPLSRVLVYQNRVTNSLLAANDWGGIETWQGGPAYVFNNISGNPNGYWNWAYNPKTKPGSARLGFAYYLDGGFKNYHFNNVAWGISNDLKSRHCSNTAFYHAVPTTHNTFFNNTAYLFAKGSGWSPAGGRQLNLGNLWHDISLVVFKHGKQKEDKGAVYKHYPLETIGYSRNVFYNVPQQFGVLEGSGSGKTDLAGFRRAAAERGLLASDIGEITPTSPVRDAAGHDFRPVANSALIDRGAKVFVPWSLYAMVGEWNFRRNNADPSVLFDDHWYMTPYYVNRQDYRKAPEYRLKAVNVTAKDYIDGPLEDWTRGALRFNGTDQYATISHQELTKPYSYRAKAGRKDKKGKTFTASGDQLATPDIQKSNFLVEIYFRAEPRRAGGVLVAKMSGSGYQLAIGRTGVTLTLQAGGQKADLTSRARTGDGKWHHVIAEVDRKAGRATIYVDGKKAATGELALPMGSSLSNTGDLFVGRGPDGRYFAGAIEFLRIARGTLADAKTTIEELYAWQFDGPFLRDFAGRKPTGKRRDAGAFEYIGR